MELKETFKFVREDDSLQVVYVPAIEAQLTSALKITIMREVWTAVRGKAFYEYDDDQIADIVAQAMQKLVDQGLISLTPHNETTPDY